MNLRYAQAIFRLDSKVSMKRLNILFRDLVKKYHPDKVRGHVEWAHEKMAEINEAYELLAQKINGPVLSEKEQTPSNSDTVTNDEDNENFNSEPRKHIMPLKAEESSIFYPLFNGFLDGLGLYYQYGLENPSYRSEGIRRFRYREAMRAIIKGRNTLENFEKAHKHPIITAVTRFTRLTVADIDLGEVKFPSASPSRKYDKRMRDARQSFDKSIKVILFPELVPRHLRSRSYTGLYSCYSEFINYLTAFEGGEYRKVGILQAARYDAFMTLIRLRNTKVLVF